MIKEFFIITSISLLIYLIKRFCFKKPAPYNRPSTQNCRNYRSTFRNVSPPRTIFAPLRQERYLRESTDLVITTDSYFKNLYWASRNSRVSLITDLLSQGADVNERSCKNRTPLHVAAEDGDARTIEFLLQNGADVNAQDKWQRTALYYSIKRNYVEGIRILVSYKADANLKNNRGDTALMEALQRKRSFEVVKLLVDSGADVNTVNLSTPLLEACKIGGNFKAVELLLKNGADVNARDTLGKTALHYSVVNNAKVVRLLLDHNADVNVKDDDGEIALFEASRYFQRLKTVQLLLDYGSDVNSVRLKDGSTVLHEVCKRYNKNLKVIKLLLENGADANTVDLKGRTPLITIFTYQTKRLGEEACIKKLEFLLEYTDVNAGAIRECHILNCVENQIHWKILVEHIAKLRALGLQVDPSILGFISYKYRNYFQNCEIELEKAKGRKLKHSWLTFFNFLVDDRRKLKNYAGNQDLMDDFGEICSWRIFPYYGQQMEKNVKKGVMRRKLFDVATVMLSYHLPIFNPNHLIVRDILDCVLSAKDLTKLYDYDFNDSEVFD